MEKVYYIKTLSMLKYLTGLGHKCIDIVPNYKNPRYNVFIFEDTEELRESMSNYKRA